MGESPPIVVLVIEKPYVASRIQTFVRDAWPASQVVAVPLMSMGLHRFVYPRGRALADYPLILEPRWGRPETGAPLTLHLNSDGWARGSADLRRLLDAASEIVFVGEPDPRAVIGYDVLLSHEASAAARARARRAVLFHAFDDRGLGVAFASPCDVTEPAFQSALRAGQGKRFFDYNFNVNALALLRPALRSAGASAAAVVSKFGLQVLYYLRKTGPQTQGGLIQQMHDWPGTGRYGEVGLGSPTSRVAILATLEAAGLIDVGEPRDRMVGLSKTGRAFLVGLHPDCEDPDLPARLGRWVATWPESRPTMERYLRTFFGKQRRFGARG